MTHTETPSGIDSIIKTQPRYFNTKHAADYLTISPSTLNRMRVSGEGPRYAKAGRRVIYAPTDLDAWVEARKQTFTGQILGS